MIIIGWACVVCGFCAGVCGVVILFKFLIGAILERDFEEGIYHLMTAFFGLLIGGGSCAGLMSLGACILGWK